MVVTRTAFLCLTDIGEPVCVAVNVVHGSHISGIGCLKMDTVLIVLPIIWLSRCPVLISQVLVIGCIYKAEQ